MPDAPVPTQRLPPSKARIFVNSLVDFGVDLLLPTAIFALLAPTGLSEVVRLTIGGFFVAAKASAGHLSAADGAEARAEFKTSLLVGILIALVSTAVTVTVRQLSGSDRLAMALGISVLGVFQGITLARKRRRLDGFALLVLVELAATIMMAAISNNPRFVLIRPSFYTVIAAIYILSTVRTPRPFVMQVSKPMAAAGDPVMAEAFERAGRESPPFRRAEQAMTVGLAVTLLGEAVLRVVTVFFHPKSSVLASSLWSQVPAIGLFVVYFAIVRLVFIPRASREVDALMPEINPDTLRSGDSL
jgi:hypothetical protein